MANPGILPMAAFLLQNGGGFQAPQQQAPMDEGEPISVSGRNPYERKGLFGMKGTLRDVLGTIGDAFLIQSGNKQIYSPIRQREHISDAMRGFTDDPLSAIQALNKAGFPEQAQSLYQDYTKQRQEQATQDLAERKFGQDQITDEALIGQRTLSAQDKAVTIASKMMSNISDNEEYQRRLPAIRAFLEKNGLSSFANDLPEKFSPEISKWGLQQYQAQRLADFDEGLSNQRRGQDISSSTQRRGQDISATTQRRGQDIRSADTRRGQDVRGSGGRKAPEIPPRAPKGKNDAIRGPSGATFISKDGKTWERTN